MDLVTITVPGGAVLRARAGARLSAVHAGRHHRTVAGQAAGPQACRTRTGQRALSDSGAASAGLVQIARPADAFAAGAILERRREIAGACAREAARQANPPVLAVAARESGSWVTKPPSWRPSIARAARDDGGDRRNRSPDVHEIRASRHWKLRADGRQPRACRPASDYQPSPGWRCCRSPDYCSLQIGRLRYRDARRFQKRAFDFCACAGRPDGGCPADPAAGRRRDRWSR